MRKASGSKTLAKKKDTTKRRGRRPKKILEEVDESEHDIEISQENDTAESNEDQDAPAIIAKLPYIPSVKSKSGSNIGGMTRSRGILEMTQSYDKIHRSDNDKKMSKHSDAGKKKRGRKPKKFEPVLDDSDMEGMFANGTGISGNCSQCVKHQRLQESLQAQITSLEKKLKGVDKLTIHINDLKLVDVNGKKYKLKKTKLRCRWDQHTFDTLPFPFPERLIDGEFHTSYCLCSPNCALKLNLQRNDSLVDQRTTLIYKLYRQMTRTPISEKMYIKPADDIDVIDCNGGPKTIEEYREDFLNLDRDCRIYVPPIRPINLIIEENIDTGLGSTELIDIPFRSGKKKPIVNNISKHSGRR
jgi:hypothetical protein